jgi:hypothetical protein
MATGGVNGAAASSAGTGFVAGRGSEGWDRTTDADDGDELTGDATCAAGCCAAAGDGVEANNACKVDPAGDSCRATRGAGAGSTRTSGAG